MSVISPVEATSRLAGRPVSSDASAARTVIPADGPSFGTAPRGMWMCRSWRSKKSGAMPTLAALLRR